jgi:bifunctional non-homologous end joining protein LigD
MLATLTDTPFSSSGWIFEPKLDGVRCLALRSGSDAQLLSRNQKRLNEKYPELVDALQKLRADDFAVDGEIVIFDGGITSFAKLQQRMQLRHPPEEICRKIPVWYYIFDLLCLNGRDIRQLPLCERKTLLKKALAFKIRFVSPNIGKLRERLTFARHARRDGRESSPRRPIVSLRSFPGLAEIQVHQRARIRDWRVHRSKRKSHRLRRIAGGLL